MREPAVADHSIVTDVGTELLLENSNCRVWLLELAPGEATRWHRHRHDYAYVVTARSTVVAEYVDGEVDDQGDQPVGTMKFVRCDVPHRLVNVGPTAYQNIVIEFLSS
jgi:mannose-6-phosphate isomerase-like protein (cupin superfamily)